MSDLTTMSHEQLTALLEETNRKWHETPPERKLHLMNLENRIRVIRVQLAKVKPSVVEKPSDQKQGRLF